MTTTANRSLVQFAAFSNRYFFSINSFYPADSLQFQKTQTDTRLQTVTSKLFIFILQFMFTFSEIYLLRKLLSKIKYSEVDNFELNEFANSPITNEILKKLELPGEKAREEEFHRKNPNVKRFCFEFENHIGIAIQKRLADLSESIYPVIAKWNDEELEHFALDVLGPIDFEKDELEKLKLYIKSLVK